MLHQFPYGLELLDNPADGTTNPPGTSSNSDTGRSQFDNHTYDSTPTLFLRLDDGTFLYDIPGNGAAGNPPDEVIPIPFQAGPNQPVTPGFAIAIFDEGNTPPQTATAPQTPLGFATAVAGQDGVYTFTVPNALALTEGSHFLSARVQMIDPANPQQTGFGERSLVFEIVVDQTPPPVAFGSALVADDGLHPDSDSGDPAIPATFVDRITNDLTPTFFGRAEANSIVRAYVDLDLSNTLTAGDVLIGQTVATPEDGTNQHPNGEWELTSNISMNDPVEFAALGVDGLRRILVTAEDLAGNITPPDAVEILDIFVDTAGPQVTNVYITDVPAYNLFTLKPDNVNQGPTPTITSLSIGVQDLPARAVGFLYEAVSNVPPLAPVVLQGDHSGIIPINGVSWVGDPLVPGNIATGDIVLTFAEPIPDDRFTLTLQDNIIDPAGNNLDGETNAAEPIGTPIFPTGDGIPGGDFIARFTVDSRPEIATWSQGVVYADINGNFVWDPEGQDNDFTNRDFVYNFGEQTDAYFAGNFSPAAAATASGFDKLGAYGAFAGTYQFFLDTDDDGVGDTIGTTAFQVNGIPVAGEFNAAHPGDEIGLFDGQFWYLDTNGNNNIDAGEQFATNLRGIPVVGDFNGDGTDDLATYNNQSGNFQFDLDRNGTVDDQLVFGFRGFGEKPVTGDFNLDGVDDIGLWVPHRDGQLPKDAGEFHFLISDRIAALPSNVFDAFSAEPLGNDLSAQFGDDFALPIVGNFDPPTGDAPDFGIDAHRDANPFDVNGDGVVSPLDALLVINLNNDVDFELTAYNARRLGNLRPDTSNDQAVSPLDALLVINHLNNPLQGEGEGSTETEAVDAAFAESFDDLMLTGSFEDVDSLTK